MPEGQLREYLAERAGVNPNREFFLLWVLGRDLPGAITIKPAEGQRWPTEVSHKKDEQDSGEGDTSLNFSLAGVQLKFSAVHNATGGLTIPADGVGGSWIVKLPSARFDGVPENEYAMMELARRIGIDTPETRLVSIDEISGLPKGVHAIGDQAFAIKRFDRTPNGERVHTEDFAQLFNVYPAKKYKSASYRNIAGVIWTEMGEAGIVEFVRRFVFNALIGNADMHIKNWSLIYKDKHKPDLAPAYDYISTITYIPEDALALNFVNSKAFSSLTIDQFKRFAAKARLPETIILDAVREITRVFMETWNSSDDLEIDNKIRRAIDRHLKTIPFVRE